MKATSKDSPNAEILEFLEAVEEVKGTSEREKEERVCELILKHKLVREHVHTRLLCTKDKDPKPKEENSEEQGKVCVKVWQALLKDMPMEAMVRTLDKLTTMKVFEGNSSTNDVHLQMVLKKLGDKDIIKHSKIHPFNLLLAWKCFEAKEKTSATEKIKEELEKTFYSSLGNITPTQKRILVTIDGTASMGFGSVKGSNLVAADAVAAMALVTMKTSSAESLIMASTGKSLHAVEINAEMKLQEIWGKIKEPHENELEKTRVKYSGMKMTEDTENGACRPMQWALAQKRKFDAFIVITDSNSDGFLLNACPGDVLRSYRTKMNLPSCKLVVCVTSREPEDVTIPDCEGGILVICGFDATTPQILMNFIEGDF